jgi:hypothetical protein
MRQIARQREELRVAQETAEREQLAAEKKRQEEIEAAEEEAARAKAAAEEAERKEVSRL